MRFQSVRVLSIQLKRRSLHRTFARRKRVHLAMKSHLFSLPCTAQYPRRRTCMKIGELTKLPVALSYFRLLPNTVSSKTVWPSGYTGTSTAASTSASVVTEFFQVGGGDKANGGLFLRKGSHSSVLRRERARELFPHPSAKLFLRIRGQLPPSLSHT